MRRTFISLIAAFTLFISLFPFHSTAQKKTAPREGDEPQRKVISPEVIGGQDNPDASVTTLNTYRGQLTKTQVESPGYGDMVSVINNADSPADVDFVAVDAQGNEAARETEVVGPNGKAKFILRDLFPELAFGDLSTIYVQSSVRPAGNDGETFKSYGNVLPNALQLSVAFFSQRDPRWANNQLGTCYGTTISQAGCAISSIAMAGARSVYNFNPATLNTYLTKNGGYSGGCNVYWASPANIDGSGGFTYVGTGVGTVSSAANLKSLIDGSKFPVARSYRFTSSTHYVVIIGYYNQGSVLSDFYYLDPWDTSAVFRRVNDGWVTAGSAIHIYK